MEVKSSSVETESQGIYTFSTPADAVSIFNRKKKSRNPKTKDSMTHFGTYESGPTNEVDCHKEIDQNNGLCFLNKSGETIDTLNQSQFFSKIPSVLQTGLVHPRIAGKPFHLPQKPRLYRHTTLHPFQYFDRHHETS
jgi:hypothetical protein